MDVQFSSHAVERVLGRMASVTSYAEVQLAVAKASATSHRRIVIKRLCKTVAIRDETAVGGLVKGDTVYAHVTPRNGGLVVDTVCLDF